MGKVYVCDTETLIDKDKTRVWAWSMQEVEGDDYRYGNTIDTLIEQFKGKSNYTVFFHNLRFDGEFIFYYLLHNGFTEIEEEKDEVTGKLVLKKKSKTFNTLIGSMGEFYTIKIFFEVSNKRTNEVTIYDSLKLINMPVSAMPSAFGIDNHKKLEIDYKAYRDIGHALTVEEQNYIKEDVVIVAKALEFMFKEGLSKKTIASNALAQFKELVSYFDTYFPSPTLEVDEFIRLSYKGGFVYVNPAWLGKTTPSGLTFDVNSLYPSVLYNEYLPIGEGIHYEGKYVEDKLYNLYVQEIIVSFRLKSGKLPSLQIKNDIRFNESEYATVGDNVNLVLTNVDLELMFMQYDILDIKYIQGFKYKSAKTLFRSYIDKYMEIKKQATITGNKGLRTIAKLLLNSLYGKFGLNPKSYKKHPYLKDDDTIGYYVHKDINGDIIKEVREPIYIPVATFTTSYARRKTILTSQKIRDYTLKKYGVDGYYYSDTDSCSVGFITKNEAMQIIDVDDVELGYWKCESYFTKARFLHTKCYIKDFLLCKKVVIPPKFKINKYNLYSFYTKMSVTVAGMQKSLYKYITWDNFHEGFSTDTLNIPESDWGLKPKHVRGGIVLTPTPFKIRGKS